VNEICLIVPGNCHILFELCWQCGSWTPILSTGNISGLFFCP